MNIVVDPATVMKRTVQLLCGPWLPLRGGSYMNTYEPGKTSTHPNLLLALLMATNYCKKWLHGARELLNLPKYHCTHGLRTLTINARKVNSPITW